MTAEVGVENDALGELPFAVDVFPDEPARRPVAGESLHFDGENIGVAVVVEIGRLQRMQGAARSVVAARQRMRLPLPPRGSAGASSQAILELGFSPSQITTSSRPSRFKSTVAVCVALTANGGSLRAPRLGHFVHRPPPAAVDVLEPDVAANYVQIAVGVEIAQRDARVDRLADGRRGPRARAASSGIVYQRTSFRSDIVSTSSRLSPSTSPRIRSWTAFSCGSKTCRMKGLLARRFWILVPRAAGDEVDPAIAVDVERLAADVGRRIVAQVMPDPLVGRLILIPKDPPVLLAGDEVQIAVAVEIGQVGLTHVAAGEVAVAEVVAEAEFGAGIRVTCSDKNGADKD